MYIGVIYIQSTLYVSMCVYIYIYIYTPQYMHVFMCVYVYTPHYMHACMCVYIYTSYFPGLNRSDLNLSYVPTLSQVYICRAYP